MNEIADLLKFIQDKHVPFCRNLGGLVGVNVNFDFSHNRMTIRTVFEEMNFEKEQAVFDNLSSIPPRIGETHIDCQVSYGPF